MRGLVPALLIAAAFPGGASAAAVTAAPEDEIQGGELSIGAAGAQHNSLTVTTRNGRATVTETGRARLKAGSGCRQRAPRRVTCRLVGDNAYVLSAELGSGDDRLSVVDPKGDFLDMQLGAGPGNDRIGLRTRFGASLYGGPGRDVLRGSVNADFVQGGGGRDRLFGRTGADVLTGDSDSADASGSDLLDGGRGRDTASWQGHARPVVADLAAGIGGRRGERDRLRGVENLSGGYGPDVLRGDAGRNVIWGGPGVDRMVGRAGSDAFDGGASTVQASSELDGAHDLISCGRGADTVNELDEDALPADCEFFSATGIDDVSETLHAQPRRTRAGVQVESYCLWIGYGCTRRAALFAHGRELGRSETRRGDHAGQHLWMTVPLRRQLPRHTRIAVVVTGTELTEERDSVDFRFAWSIRR